MKDNKKVKENNVVNLEEISLNIDRLEDENLQLTNQLKRALADYQNLERNTQKRVSLMYFQSKKSLVEKLIPVIDDLSMAIKIKDNMDIGESTRSWINGIVAILNNLEKSLEDIGLKKYIPEKDSIFDPSIHEALTTVPGEKEGLIFDVVQPGYILEDIVIRPSRVVVTKNK